MEMSSVGAFHFQRMGEAGKETVVRNTDRALVEPLFQGTPSFVAKVCVKIALLVGLCRQGTEVKQVPLNIAEGRLKCCDKAKEACSSNKPVIPVIKGPDWVFKISERPGKSKDGRSASA